jgi:hypothetical protein
MAHYFMSRSSNSNSNSGLDADLNLLPERLIIPISEVVQPGQLIGVFFSYGAYKNVVAVTPFPDVFSMVSGVSVSKLVCKLPKLPMSTINVVLSLTRANLECKLRSLRTQPGLLFKRRHTVKWDIVTDRNFIRHHSDSK